MSIDGSFSVEHGGYADNTDMLAMATRDIQHCLDELQSRLGSLLRGEGFDGNAKDAYNTAQTAWNNAFNKMGLHLNQAHVVSQDIHDNYKTADARGASRFM
ncbi:MAG TPA: WXG100 family type VII secretion target [Actinomadura sp.]|jgi:uncharacterized protein YukE|nr:WXG100 family type VII secretion target [Actinomadura sp.]